MDRRRFLKCGFATLLAGSIGSGLWGCEKKSDRISLRLGYLPITDHLLLIAHGRYVFKHFNLMPVKYGAWPELAEALRVGALDAAFLLTPLGLMLRRQGAPVRAILLGHRNGSVLTVSSKETLDRMEDLQGKAIAVPSRFSTHYLLLRRLLAERGLDVGGIRILDMAPPEMVQALAAGRISGFIVAEPFGAQAEMMGVGRVMALSRDIWQNHICCVLNVREGLLEKHPDAVQELVDAFVETGLFIEKDRREAAVLSRPYLGQERDVMDFVLNHPVDRVTYDDLFPSEEDFRRTFLDMQRFGLWEGRGPDLGQYLEPAFAKNVFRKIAAGASSF